jgi:hypothetical protein
VGLIPNTDVSLKGEECRRTGEQNYQGVLIEEEGVKQLQRRENMMWGARGIASPGLERDSARRQSGDHQQY